MTARTPADDAGDVAEAIGIVQHSRSTHEAWIEWIDAGGQCGKDDCRLTAEEHLTIAGDREHQQSRVERYDRVLAVLRSVDEARAEADNLRVALGAVVDRFAEGHRWNRGEQHVCGEDRSGTTEYTCRALTELRAILSADPVSLADVRAEAWDEGHARGYKDGYEDNGNGHDGRPKGNPYRESNPR